MSRQSAMAFDRTCRLMLGRHIGSTTPVLQYSHPGATRGQGSMYCP